MKLKFDVMAGAEVFNFTFRVRISLSPGQLHLHPIDFYQWHTHTGTEGKIPDSGKHYELEILEPDEEFFSKHELHTKRSRINNKLVVCYNDHIPRLDSAITLVRAWSLGSAVTVSKGVDINSILDACYSDITKVENYIAEKFGISGTAVVVSGPVMDPLTPGAIEEFKNPRPPWEHYGYFTFELADEHPEHCVPNTIPRDENIVVSLVGTINATAELVEFNALNRTFEIRYEHLKNIRGENGKLIWVNKP